MFQIQSLYLFHVFLRIYFKLFFQNCLYSIKIFLYYRIVNIFSLFFENYKLDNIYANSHKSIFMFHFFKVFLIIKKLKIKEINQKKKTIEQNIFIYLLAVCKKTANLCGLFCSLKLYFKLGREEISGEDSELFL